MSVTFRLDRDNTDEVLQACEDAIQLALEVIGLEAEGLAKGECPVDTGVLRNSINFKTADAQGTGDSEPHGNPPKKNLQVGTNVKYAKYQEFGDSLNHTTGKAHFLRDSIANNGDVYLEILKAALQDSRM